MSTFVHKIGATLYLVGELRLNGQVQDMTGWAVRSQMRGPAGVVDLVCEWLDPAAGALSVGAPAADQAGWRAGRYAIDVRLTSPAGVVLISASRDVQLVAAVTQPSAP